MGMRSGGAQSVADVAQMAAAVSLSSPTKQAPVTAATPPPPPPPPPAAPTPTPPPPSNAVESRPTVLVQPEEAATGPTFWEWNAEQKLIAMVEGSQLLKVIDSTGKTIYRVQLPREGRTIFLGWEPSGAALAAVQDHGGAFLWFPAKPDCVQQWEGMQFASQVLRSSSGGRASRCSWCAPGAHAHAGPRPHQVLRSSAIKRNSHFDTCFASWSSTRKLVLGLADGN